MQINVQILHSPGCEMFGYCVYIWGLYNVGSIYCVYIRERSLLIGARGAEEFSDFHALLVL